MNHAVENRARAIAEAVMRGRVSIRLGLVTSYDPASYSVKVQLLPDLRGTSGWIPVGTQKAGNGFGIYAPPELGDLAVVAFDQGKLDAGMLLCCLPNDEDRPPSVPAGEMWAVHKSGSMLRFHNDGQVTLEALGTLNTAAPLWQHAGPVEIDGTVHTTGNITSDGDIADQGGAKTMSGMREAHNGHSHPPDANDLPDLEM